VVLRGASDRLKVVSRIACGCTDAIGDEPRLRAAVTEPLATVLGARCVLALAHEPVPAASATAAQLPLRYGETVLGVLQVDREDRLDDDDLVLARLVAEHAAVAWAKHLARAPKVRFADLDRVGALGIVVSDLEGRIFEINDTLAGIIGYSCDEVRATGFRWSEMTPEDWRAADLQAVAELRATGVTGLREKPYIRKDGARVWVLVGSTVVDHEVVSFVIDIDARKQAELAAQKARERSAVAEVNARLAAIVDSTDDAIIGKTLEGVVTSWNHGAEKLFGYTVDEMRGRSIAILIPDERLHEETELLAHLARGEVTRFETLRRRKDGTLIDVAVTSSPIYDGERVVGASKVARDITSRKVAETALAQAVASAQAANRELEAFRYSVAHDLRAPVRAVNGFAQILSEDYGEKLDAEGRALIADIRGGAKTMGTLIDALLSLARLTRSELHREDADLAAIARSVVATLAAAQPDRHVELLAKGPLNVTADPRLLRVVVDNLVGNAWKFTGKVEHATIEIGETRCDGARTFFIRDNGAGFDMAHAANLFGPFQRLHTVREFAGTGIGLATVQRIVHRHGGRIWAESAVAAGATFYFTLEAKEARS